MRKLFRSVKVSRLKVSARILKRGKKKKEKRKRRVGTQSRIRELADRNERVFPASVGKKLIVKLQPQMNTDKRGYQKNPIHLCLSVASIFYFITSFHASIHESRLAAMSS